MGWLRKLNEKNRGITDETMLGSVLYKRKGQLKDSFELTLLGRHGMRRIPLRENHFVLKRLKWLAVKTALGSLLTQRLFPTQGSQ